jgi:hypothetical protein
MDEEFVKSLKVSKTIKEVVDILNQITIKNS